MTSVVRSKRTTGPNLVTSRVFECVQTGNKGYWKYDYTIPDTCYSKKETVRDKYVIDSHCSHKLHQARPGEYRSH